MERVLITGCSSGFGRAAAIELKKRGHEVVATARRPETLDDLDVDQRLALDVTDDASVAAAVAAAGAIDVLVNNAGVGGEGPVELAPLEEARREFETNFFGAIRMIHAVLPQMRERGSGRIINVSSVAGKVTTPLRGYYSATKRALEAVSEALHVEARHFGIRTIVIEPGYFSTNAAHSDVEHGMDGPPYDELRKIMDGVKSMLGYENAPGPEMVAVAIADAIEASDPELRIPVGEDAHMVLGARQRMTDPEFEASMRTVLHLDW